MVFDRLKRRIVKAYLERCTLGFSYDQNGYLQITIAHRNPKVGPIVILPEMAKNEEAVNSGKVVSILDQG